MSLLSDVRALGGSHWIPKKLTQSKLGRDHPKFQDLRFF